MGATFDGASINWQPVRLHQIDKELPHKVLNHMQQITGIFSFFLIYFI